MMSHMLMQTLTKTNCLNLIIIMYIYYNLIKIYVELVHKL
jgi:hypothetical protein